jgi:hypothetical protein
MKKLIAIAIASFLIAVPIMVKACEITISVDGTKKEVYKAGDVVVLKITVVLKHRNCDVDINETNVNVSGMLITGATKWVNTEGKTWERKIKVKILSDKSDKALILAERTCDRDGGKGSLILTTANDR